MTFSFLITSTLFESQSIVPLVDRQYLITGSLNQNMQELAINYAQVEFHFLYVFSKRIASFLYTQVCAFSSQLLGPLVNVGDHAKHTTTHLFGEITRLNGELKKVEKEKSNAVYAQRLIEIAQAAANYAL